MHECNGCKYYKRQWMQRVLGMVHTNRCTHPRVLGTQGVKRLGFCSVARLWPCRKGELYSTRNEAARRNEK